MRKNDYNTNPPYVICFSERPKATKNVKGKLPSWCRVPIPKAEEAVYYQFPDIDILSQKLNRLHFSANAVEIHTSVPFELPFQVNEDQLFFLYMLEGGMEFSTADGLYITQAQKKNFYLSHNGPGMFKARMEAGKHVAFVVAIKVSWAKRNFQEFANLNPLLQEMLNATQPYNIMPHCRIDKQVEQWLAEAISTPHTNTVVQDSTFRMFISLTLEHYDELLAASQGMLAYKVKQYIDEHYTDHDISNKKLATIFCLTERTLRNQFKKEFHVTIHDYYTALRMKKAKYLIEVQRKAVREIYYQLGYNDERNFRYVFTRFFGNQSSK